MLSEIENEEDLTVQACADILYAVHQEGTSHTLFSNIFDPVNLDVYLNYGENYQKQKKVNLLEELRQRESFELFNISYLTGVDGNLLVKSVRIDEDFYALTVTEYVTVTEHETVTKEATFIPSFTAVPTILGLTVLLWISRRFKK